MLEIIREADLFEGVSENIVAEIARKSEKVTFEAGSVIYRVGEASSHIYKLIEGSVDLIMMERHVVHLTVAPTGQIFGWSALVQPYTRMATAKCTAPTTVVRMSRGSLEKIIEDHPHEGLTILKNLARIVTHRLRDAYTYIHYYGKPDASS